MRCILVSALLVLAAARLAGAVVETPDRFIFDSGDHEVQLSKADGSLLSIAGATGEISEGGADGLWRISFADDTTLSASEALADPAAVFSATLVAPDQVDLNFTHPGVTVTVSVTDRPDGVDFSAEVIPAAGGKTVLELELPADLRFDPADLGRFIAPNHSSDGVGMAFNTTFFEEQTEDNAATWKEVPQADGGLGYRTLFGSGLSFETSDPVPLAFTTEGTAWLGAAVETAWDGSNAVVNRPPAAGQWDLLLIDSTKGPYFSGSHLGGGAGAGYLLRVGGNVNGAAAVARSRELVTAAVGHLAQAPGGRTKVGVLRMERGPVIGESWPSEVHIDQWIESLSDGLLGTGIEVVEIRDYSEMSAALVAGDHLAILNPYGENIPASLAGGVLASVNALRDYVHGGGNWFEVGGHPFFFALQPELYYSVELPYPPAFADFFQLETGHGNAALFGVQPVLTDPSTPWTTSELFVPGNLSWGADSAGGRFSRSFATHVVPGQSWTSPVVRLAFGHDAPTALGEYAAANGITRGLDDKITSADIRDRFKQSLLLRVLGTANELTSRIPEIPSPAILHFTQYLKGGFDKEYPDHLPVASSFGTEAEFETFLSGARSAGFLTMPYTNPTFWGIDPKGPTWTAIGNDDPLLRTLDGSLQLEEYFGEAGFAASPWHPAVRAANEKTVDLFHGDPEGNHPTETNYEVDLFFQDQVGARTWAYDLNPASPAPHAYVHGLIALNAEDSTKLPVSTENGFDRIINFQSQFCGLAWGLAPTPGAPFWRRFLSDRYDPATWEIFPLAQHLAHDKLAFTFNNLGASTANDETVAWALGLGYGMTYFFDESKLDEHEFKQWLGWIDRVQKSVAARYIGEGVQGFDHEWGAGVSTPDAGRIAATYGEVQLVANLGPENRMVGLRTLAPHGFVAEAPGLVAARMIEPGGTDPIRFVAESDGNWSGEFWIHTTGGQTVTIELPVDIDGSVLVQVDGAAGVPTVVAGRVVSIALPPATVPGEEELWHGMIGPPFAYTLNPGNTVTIDDYLGAGGTVTVPATIAGYPVVAIAPNAFNGDAAITELTLPDGLETIGNFAFAGCTGIAEIVIPDSVSLIGDHAFRDMSGLSTLDLGNGVETIGFASFQGCVALGSVVIPDSVMQLGANAFWGCTNLSTLTFGGGLGAIGTSAFQGCVALQEVTIPGNIASIGDFAFYGCSSLGSLVLEEGIESIGQGTFQACPELEHVTVPASVDSIGSFAFALGGGMKGLYFGAAPPTATSSILQGNPDAVVYYAPGVSGWTDPWNTWPTAPWDPIIGQPGFAGGEFSFIIAGSSDFAVRVEWSDNLGADSWSKGGIIVLTGGNLGFTDDTSTGLARRFYRLRMP
ncbi:leucine-rich repeat protein [Haloferula sp.]|uniref:leucine-rich repeat domain-containing protein n=1 Tax=Haloferula sp. TaxID=2497595 RepID=UPI003C7228B3